MHIVELKAELLLTVQEASESHLLGVHYEGVSWLMLLSGDKVGKRVYWPGSDID